MHPLLALLLLPGCGREATEALWIQGAGFGWDLFNHRVSHAEWTVDEDGARAAIIGGTSTTGVSPELDAACDPDTCDELPFLDESLVELRWVHATSEDVVFARGSVELVADADGAEGSLQVALPRKARGEAVAVLAGLSFDSNHPLSGGDACYNPAYGWHPTRMAVSLGAAALSDDRLAVTVPVHATFAAGESLEEIRQCVDAVNDQAQVPVRLDVVVAVTRGAFEQLPVSHGLTYSYGDGPATPDEQPDPDLADRTLSTTLASPVLGWSALDWTFYASDPDGRGAYLRTLSFDADAAPDAGAPYASGHATNYSPITQLSGFEYSFSGTVTAIELESGSAEGGLATGTLPAELDADGAAVVHTLDW
ncbi:hypothetical protein L6R53_09870 [Myxococcota bacterium]|nr:hypothetical protein [Myxococcota bacterium]